jgi:hypothetical protein
LFPLCTNVDHSGALGDPTTSMAALKGTCESQESSESKTASSTKTSKVLTHPTGATAASSPNSPGARVLRRRRPTAKSGGIKVSTVEVASTIISAFSVNIPDQTSSIID